MSLQSLEGIGPATEERLNEADVRTVEQLATANAPSLAEKTGVAEGQLEAVIERAQDAMEAGETPTNQIDSMIEDLPHWQGKVLSQVRRLVKEADPHVVEDVKWRKPSNPAGVPVWSHEGMICTGETYKNKVKLTFAKGASLDDPTGLFNASLGGNTRRAIDIHEGDEIDGQDFRALVRAAVALNES